jgi:hypothetical protein
MSDNALTPICTRARRPDCRLARLSPRPVAAFGADSASPERIDRGERLTKIMHLFEGPDGESHLAERELAMELGGLGRLMAFDGIADAVIVEQDPNLRSAGFHNAPSV